MNILSLFDGISCGQVALNRAGIKYDKYFASEIDKHAIKVTMKNFPNTIQLGSVVDVDASKLPKIDLIIGGSPCQSFSFAGKRKGMATKDEQEILTLEQYMKLKSEGYEFEGQSYLFWEYMRLLTELKPKYFFLENVEMGEKWERVLSFTIGVKPLRINSNLVSAQNRKRLYWTNIGMVEGGLFGESESIITQPIDKKIFLKDILENEVDNKYYLSEKQLAYINREDARECAIDGDKAITQTARQYASWNGHFVKIGKDGKEKADQEKASCFTAGGHSGGNHSDMDLIVCGAMRGRYIEDHKSRVSGLPTEQVLEIRGDLKTNTLTSVQKDNLVVGCDYRNDEGLRIKDDGKTGTLQARAREDESCSQMAIVNQKIRRLTPIECERLQTLDDGYTEKGLDIHYLSVYNNILEMNGDKKCKNVKLTNANEVYVIKNQSFATNIILDLLDTEQQNLQENLSLKLQNVQLRHVQEKYQQTKDSVLCTIKDLLDMGKQNFLLEYLKNASFAIEMHLQKECAEIIITMSIGTQTHCIPIKLEILQTSMDIKNLKEIIGLNIEKLFQSYSEGSYCVMMLSTILTLINRTTMNLIYIYVMDKKSIRLCIANLIISQENWLSWDILDLRTENIILISSSQRYKSIGNGWTVDVITHIFNYLCSKK